jgi:hypothetical protein
LHELAPEGFSGHKCTNLNELPEGVLTTKHGNSG